MGRAMMTGLAVAFGAYTVYLGRDWDEDELKAKKMVRLSSYFRATLDQIRSDDRECTVDTVGQDERAGHGSIRREMACSRS